ncbi:hypothetical protein H8K20_08370 [Neobittarella massiliensis]|uniref:DUF6870 domain-containing protein n=1 Tax=Neobittarella massiliensis (ex Bilen et al. 2018) TaxID=2041842 RepID=A0A8J6IFX9_9FIRM|nr:hypothetical protein [Neobittarella massiliensis]MBC3516410.1 hypothetical protein [Neobittarella massiliensis]
MDVEKIDRKTLMEMQKIQLDVNLPREQRVKHFLEETSNPYCFCLDEIKIKLEFADDSSFLQEMFTQLLLRKRN